ncbi:DUF3300 domain-containing protein [Thioalkalivibrio sulfidiphilus]|uniref:DUF3300 domain-containing protein n=1 Tax=Thioalkalivibrio sulfidiphilus TaxID=1033854 RepID=UPI001E2FEB72|nr:DUF3300 domain-containing protein [Thioalkalivibrio sulfidiphilus]
MNTHRRSPAAWLSACLLALLLGLSPAHAQGQETYSEAELASLLAPIALYPDALLSQILMASTYPLEVVEAARWSRRNPGLEGSAAVDAVADMDWDPSVKALVAFPRVIQQMSDDLTWTRQVGDAFLLQEEDVADMVQELRQRAYDAGHLEDREHVRVVREREIIYIEPASPRVVYVPYYQPTIVYGGWWWPAYAPVYWGPPYGYSVSIGITWVSGVPVSRSFFYSGFNWTHRHVVIIHHYDYRTRHYVPAGHRWRHDPWHRRGVAYRHHTVHQRRSGDATAQAQRERTRTGPVTDDTRRSINSRDLHQGHSDRIREGWSREGQNRPRQESQSRPRQEAQQPSRPAWNAAGETGRGQASGNPHGGRDGGWRGQVERQSGWQAGRGDGNLGRGEPSAHPRFRSGQSRGEGRHSFAR